MDTHILAASDGVSARATAGLTSSYGHAASLPPRITITRLSDRIRGEFEEAPGLAITVDQAVRFWVLDAQTCAHVLGELREVGFLVETANGYYRRRSTS